MHSVRWLAVTTFPYLYSLAKLYPHTHTQIPVQFYKLCIPIQRWPCLQLLLWTQVLIHDTVLYFCNVLTNVISADTKSQQEAQIEHSLLEWEWGGFFFLSHVTPRLECSQSSEEQMQEHIYKAGLRWADTHEACSVPIFLHRQAVLKQRDAPSYINMGQTVGPHERPKSGRKLSVGLIPI